jgi:hypothetical protein
MPGETDLAILLASLDPRLDPLEYGFAILGHAAPLPEGLVPLCLFREDEGLTLIAPARELAAHGIATTGGWARITLMVQSSLEAVGMTAAMSAALTRAGISANVVAAYHHDHVFVPWARRDEAVAVLRQLAQRGGTTS